MNPAQPRRFVPTSPERHADIPPRSSAPESSRIGGRVRLDEVVRRLQEGGRVPDVSPREQALAWIRFFSRAERIERAEREERADVAPRHPDSRSNAGAA